MNIFIPHQRDRNIYFDEVISCSDFNFIYGAIKDYKPEYEIVHIQFPDAIFSFIPPTNEELKFLEENILIWKIKSRLVLTLNDLTSHYDQEDKFGSLFKLIRKYADGVIHLGRYSYNNFKNLFPDDCQHKIIFHPLYISLLTQTDDSSFENQFNISFKNKYIVSAVGNIRSMEEVKLLLKIFRKIPIKNKYLVVPNMFNFTNTANFRPYRFRNIYKKVYEQIVFFPLKKEQYYFGYKFLDNDLMVDLVKKSSLILIPRIRNLNSGVLYLGLTFSKPMIIPKIGNQTEIAEFFKLPLLDLEKKNYEQVLSIAAISKMNNISLNNEFEKKKEQFHPKIIAQEHERFYKSLIHV